MGTRNLTVVIDKQGDTKVAQYGQWDGYPSGLGISLLDILHEDCKKLEESLKNAVFIGEKEMTDVWKSLGVDIVKNKGFVSIPQSNLLLREHTSLHRDTAGDAILNMLINNEYDIPVFLMNRYDFAADSLYCEWCYVIDFNSGTFEVYKGNNEELLDDNERFKDLETREDIKDGYFPVRLAKSFKLNKRPTGYNFLKLFERYLND